MGQGVVTVIGPAEPDTLRSVTPTFAVRTEDFPPDDRPARVGIQVARDPSFAGPLDADTSVAGDTATITLGRPLAELSTIYWRGFAETSSGARIFSDAVGPRTVPIWLRLVQPNNPAGQTITTRRPRFTWSSPAIASPPGPWIYDFEIVNSATGVSELRVVGLLDTTFTPAADLEANTSYRWRVRARLMTGDVREVSSFATFVIVDATRPLTTILFQNFPNPFPTPTSPRTCFWFDLAQPALVRLEVFDIRGRLVRIILPAHDLGPSLPSGRYGRASRDGVDAGCDERFSWDGSGEDGRVVPPGVYLVRLSTDGAQSMRKILFRGR